MRKLLSLVSVLLVISLFAACGKENQVGSQKLKDIQESGNKGPRLGEKIPEPSNQPTQGALGAPTPKESPTSKAPEEKYFDVTLVDYSPYYEPGAALTMPVGYVLRVTNKDSTEGRPQRSFEAADGSFSSGPLKPGQTWTQKFDSAGFWKVKDMAAGFILAELEVS